MNQYLDIDYLIDNHYYIHYFGLGFIQVKLTPTERVHFYTDAFGKVGVEEIHNHRYSFTSTVLKGMLYNKLYEVNEDENGLELKKQVSCNAEHVIDSEPVKVKSKYLKFNKVYAGECYYIDHNMFHKVDARNGTVTLITRGGYEKEFADVVSPINKETVCPFSITVSPMECFEAIREILR